MDLQLHGILTSRSVGGVTVITFAEKSYIREEWKIRVVLERLCCWLSAQKSPKILLDMSKVDYISSNGLGLLIALSKKCKGNSGVLKLCCVHPFIDELLVTTRLNQIFEILPTVEDAVSSFSAELAQTL